MTENFKTDASPIIWQSAARTHRGKRRPTNEDAILDRPQARLWAVADGLGGHYGGRLASRAVISALATARLPEGLADRVDALDDLLQGMNARLRRRAQALGQVGMGTTVVALTVCGAFAVVLWAGDSRLYRLRDGRFELLTRDHTPRHDRVGATCLPDEEAEPDDSHVVTRAVGCHSALHVDAAIFDVAPDDTLLLCSDGLFREVGRSALVAALADDEPEAIAAGLLAQCLAGPARDNVSLVILRAREAAADAAAMRVAR